MISVNDGHALLGPDPSILTPPEIDQRASPSGYFLPPCRDSPEKSRFAKIYIFTLVFNDLLADRGPKMEPPGATADFATPPPGSQKSPRKSACGPPGPKQRPRDLFCAQPPGGPRGATGGSLRFCYTSRLILIPEMLLWPLFRACIFFSKPDLNWAARSRKFKKKIRIFQENPENVTIRKKFRKQTPERHPKEPILPPPAPTSWTSPLAL